MGYFPVRYNSRVVIYERKMFIRLATGCNSSPLSMQRKKSKTVCSTFLMPAGLFDKNILDGFRSANFSGLSLLFKLGLCLVLQPSDVLHGHPKPLVRPAEHLEKTKQVRHCPVPMVTM